MIGRAANAQTLALAQSVVHQALMLPQYLAVQAADLAYLCGNVLFKEITKAALADKANPCGILIETMSEAVQRSSGSLWG